MALIVKPCNERDGALGLVGLSQELCGTVQPQHSSVIPDRVSIVLAEPNVLNVPLAMLDRLVDSRNCS